MTCSDCGQETLMDGVCIDCSNKRFDAYPELKENSDNWNGFVNAAASIFDIEEIDWKEGSYDFIKWFNRIKEEQRQLGAIKAFVTIMQNGDPENENPKKILDTIDEITIPKQQLVKNVK